MKNLKMSDLKENNAPPPLQDFVKKYYGEKEFELGCVAAQIIKTDPGSSCWIYYTYLPHKISIPWAVDCVNMDREIDSKVVRETLKRIVGWSKKALKATEIKLQVLSAAVYKEWVNLVNKKKQWQYQAIQHLVDLPFYTPHPCESSALEHVLNSLSNATGVSPKTGILDYRKKDAAYLEFAKIGMSFWGRSLGSNSIQLDKSIPRGRVAIPAEE